MFSSFVHSSSEGRGRGRGGRGGGGGRRRLEWISAAISAELAKRQTKLIGRNAEQTGAAGFSEPDTT